MVRPRAYESDRYPWHYGKIPEALEFPPGETGAHPGREAGVFLVHGMGQPAYAATTVALHTGLDTALDEIRDWQEAKGLSEYVELIESGKVPLPLIHEGHWGDYSDLPSTFAEDYPRLDKSDQGLFREIWTKRAISAAKTSGWFARQQLRLVDPRLIRNKDIGFRVWLLYLPLQVILGVFLVVAFFRAKGILTKYLNDVRLYVAPQGMIEKAIVQNIDRRVGTEFLRMLGLDWDFRSLPNSQCLQADGKPLRFRRVVWVAHSLGTVVSYNTMSDVLYRAAELERDGEEDQKANVAIFRKSLRRFVTMGSPLDKIAFLYPNALRPWPEGDRKDWLESTGENETASSVDRADWWINFYHGLDPVSGALGNERLTGGTPPLNRRIRSGHIPGIAHVMYWRDTFTLRFILSRTFGKRLLFDQSIKPLPVAQAVLEDMGAYWAWVSVISLLVMVILIGVTVVLRSFGAFL